MSRILIAEDSATQARVIQFRLEEAGFEVEVADNGVEALHSIRRSAPDLVLTDLQMPEMDGLQLVEAVRSQFPAVPVILMTAHGSEVIAVQALKKGAASYVPKQNLERDLVPTLQHVLEVAKVEHDHHRLLQCLTQTDYRFQLNNDPSLVRPLVAHCEQELTRMNLSDRTGVLRVAMALTEALDNAIYHGNLEVDSELRQTDYAAYHQAAERRREKPPYRDRKVHVAAMVSSDEATFVVRDEGAGFNYSALPDPTDPANLEKVSGRGLLLIRTFMDQVAHNAEGNEITMVKQRDTAA